MIFGFFVFPFNNKPKKTSLVPMLCEKRRKRTNRNKKKKKEEIKTCLQK
jgi:hypothetical protein